MARPRENASNAGRSIAELRDELAAGEPRAVYLLEGAEPFLAREALALLRRTPHEEASFDGAKAELADVLDQVRTMPLFAPRRLVVVDEADKLLARISQGAAEGAAALERYVAAPSPRATLVLVAAKLDGRLKSTKRVRESARVVDCSPLAPDALPRFLRERAKHHGRDFARGAELALLERYGGGEAGAVPLGALDAEVAKLAAAGAGDVPTPISVEEVIALASELSSDTSFGVVEAIARGDARAALETLRTIFRDGLVIAGGRGGGAPHAADARRERAPQGFGPVILGLIGWDLGRLFRARAGLLAGKSPRDVVAEAKAFRDRDGFIERARAASAESLARRHAALRESDFKIKESGDTLAVLTVLITRLALEERACRARDRSGNRAVGARR